MNGSSSNKDSIPSLPVNGVGPNQQRISLPIVPSNTSGTLDLTPEVVAELLEESELLPFVDIASPDS